MQHAARRAGALAVALVNDVASPLAEQAEALLPLWAGTESSIAATKSMIAGLVAGASLVAAWREDRPLADAIAGLPEILRAQAATRLAPATRPAIIDLVAATERSGPAHSGSSASASCASGESTSLTRAMASAPPRRAARCISMISGLRPDCEIATETAPESRIGARYSVAIDGPTDAQGAPEAISTRYFR